MPGPPPVPPPGPLRSPPGPLPPPPGPRPPPVLANFAAVAVFSGLKGNSTLSRCSGLKEFRNALVAVTTDLVCAAGVLCDEAVVARYVLSAKTANAEFQTKILLMPPL